MTYLSRKLGESSLIKEVLHLVMRFIAPKLTKVKYDTKDFKRALLSSESSTEENLQTVCYSDISSKVYREVLKRFKLWKINELGNSEEKLLPFIKFLNKTLDILKVRENSELFRNINEFYSIIQQQQYLITLGHRELVF
jgi:hypothetical protein